MTHILFIVFLVIMCFGYSIDNLAVGITFTILLIVDVFVSIASYYNRNKIATYELKHLQDLQKAINNNENINNYNPKKSELNENSNCNINISKGINIEKYQDAIITYFIKHDLSCHI